MKFSIKKNIILEQLTNVSKAISLKNIIPILNGIKFELTKEGLTLTASDSDLTIESFIPEDKIEQAVDWDSDYIEQIKEKAEHNRQILVEQKCQQYRQEAEQKQQAQRQAFFDMLRDYYNSDEWQYRRAKRLEYNQKYFGGKCERCRKKDATCVHHRSYAVLNGMEHTFDLEALCEDCHKMLHPHLRDE